MQGCLAAVASGRAVAAELTALGFEATSGREVRELLQAGEPEAARLTQAGRPAHRRGDGDRGLPAEPRGRAGGRRPGLGPAARRHPRDALPARAPAGDPAHGPAARLLGEDAAVVGLTRLVVDQEFSPDAVNARLRT